MNSEKYIGLDVHQATISVAVMDCRGFLDSSSAAKVLEGLDAQHLAFAAIVSERSSAALKRRSR